MEIIYVYSKFNQPQLTWKVIPYLIVAVHVSIMVHGLRYECFYYRSTDMSRLIKETNCWSSDYSDLDSSFHHYYFRNSVCLR